MKVNKWTLGLAAVGLVSLPSVMQAEEKASTVMTALSSTTISGYVSTSAQWNPGTGNAYVPGYAFGPGKQDGFNLDVVKLTIERPLDEAQWSAGYKVDLLFGQDANSLATTSTKTSTSDFAIKQAYVSLRAPVGNGLDFKLGVWDTIIGYESFDAGNNPNYTRSYGYSMEPTTHTGLQANYTVSPSLSFQAAIANSFGPTIDDRANPPKAESFKTYMGGVTLTAPDSWGAMKGATLSGVMITGYNSANTTNSVSQQSYYIGASVPTPISGLKVGAAYDYAGQSHDKDYGSPATWRNAASLYGSWQASEKLSFHTRGEYFWQKDAIVTPSGGPVGGSITSSPVGSLPSKVFAITETIQYDLWKNVLSRLEFRWDHSANGQDAFGGKFINTGPGTGSVSSPADLKNAVMVAANIIYKF